MGEKQKYMDCLRDTIINFHFEGGYSDDQVVDFLCNVAEDAWNAGYKAAQEERDAVR